MLEYEFYIYIKLKREYMQLSGNRKPKCPFYQFSKHFKRQHYGVFYLFGFLLQIKYMRKYVNYG